MSNRLESLNSKKPASSGGKTGLKFKPKVVQRKSKEERAKAAPPSVKEEEGLHTSTHGRSSSNRTRGPNSRGRGGGVRNNYAGTHLVMSGPLSAGSVSLGNSSGSKLGLTKDLVYNSNGRETLTSEYIKNLELKNPKERSFSGDSDSSDDENFAKINMTKVYRFADSETELFPYRPFRDDGIIRKNEYRNQETREQSPVKIESSKESTPAPNSDVNIKSENIEDKIEMIKENKAKLESKIVKTDSIIVNESSKLINDYEVISNLLADSFNNLSTEEKLEDDRYVLFQLPRNLPDYVREESKEVKIEKDVSSQEFPVATAKSKLAVPQTSHLRGEIGKVNIHQSGKITIDLGNGIILNVTRGSPTDFLQELAVINLAQPNLNQEEMDLVDDEGRQMAGEIMRLGSVNEKIIATPYI
ncbi:RPC53 [Candida oxycetoniae]|uniref:RPC53 n=1 Tax=Candida oxycetoniae TaxID=497107 RepID=A0AAI9STI3_9ASCO|nr:RPC53 [Candida oxycetoniae]KAI3402750.2 RPC53 [Candida oxycetoniae]